MDASWVKANLGGSGFYRVNYPIEVSGWIYKCCKTLLIRYGTLWQNNWRRTAMCSAQSTGGLKLNHFILLHLSV